MDAPSVVSTVLDVRLRAAAVDVVQPDLSTADAVEVDNRDPPRVSVSEHVADDPRLRVAESIVTHRPPSAIVQHFETSISRIGAFDQP